MSAYRTTLSAGLISLVIWNSAQGFPPYRSTDADTAGDSMLELRLGLLQLERENSQSARLTPLIRTNFGIGDHFEVVSEFDHSPETHSLEGGAVGFKWARIEDGLGRGVETLILLPVQPNHGGAGIESQFLTTIQNQHWQLHLNMGAFHDGRGDSVENGWRGSVLAEFPRARVRPGVELFAKNTRDDGKTTRVQLGVGVIGELELVEIRSGIHFGLNDAAPDLEVSIWFAWKWATARE